MPEELLRRARSRRSTTPTLGQFDPARRRCDGRLPGRLAGDGAALELGIGTGRIALPLAARGVPVQGIDLSPDMVAQLPAKPGAAEIGVTIGDFAASVVDGAFRLAYLVYNTIENLTSQDEQVACFPNAAAHLEPGGCFVIEVDMPALQRLPPGETVRAFTRHAGPARLRRARRGQPGSGCRTTTGSSGDGPARSPCRTATSGRPSWISMAAWRLSLRERGAGGSRPSPPRARTRCEGAGG